MSRSVLCFVDRKGYRRDTIYIPLKIYVVRILSDETDVT